MAVVCKEAAEDFMTADPDFEIVGPVVMNSDIIVETEDREVKIVGITNNKDFHIDFAKDLYGENIRIHEMKPNSLPYAYRNNQIDAMIIDINLYNEETMEGVVRHPTKGDYVSNVLIADSDFMKTQEFKDFIVEYNKTVEEINLEGLPMEYINEKTYLNERSMKYWKVKLLAIN